ncbi:MAG: endopeptidase La, partial [Myxococcota bacterium]|nr:endopeptidase La [Myxococcota bacterium]
MAMDAPQTRPALLLSKLILYPRQVVTIGMERLENRSAIYEVEEPDGRLVLLFQVSNGGVGRSTQVAPLGLEVRLLEHLSSSRGQSSHKESEEIIIQGLRRVKVLEFFEAGEAHPDNEEGFSYHQVQIESLPDFDESQLKEARALIKKLIQGYDLLARGSSRFPRDRLATLQSQRNAPERFVELFCACLDAERRAKLGFFQESDLLERLQLLHNWIEQEQKQAQFRMEIERQTKYDMEASRREYYLRQQMKTIRKELGEDDHSADEADRYQELLDALDLEEEIVREAGREIERLRHIQPSSSEFQVIKTYLDRFFALPWGEESEEQIDLPKVRQALEEEHFGLKQVKERILEFLAVRKLNPEHKGSILCFAGPPGVGKTSLGKAIAESIGRKFFRISVGGVRDEAEIRGHRRTYVGAMPGKLLTGLSRAGCKNPLLMLDEIDKIGSDHRGDPAAALLEVLDPEQNKSFTDHYFNVPFDLSKVLFVVTANYLHDIPKPLLDRLEVISIEGYTESEKVEIARNHLLPRIREDHGIGEEPPISEPALREVIRSWTREAGVRNLQRALQKISRKIARERVEEDESAPSEVSVEVLNRYLGPERYTHDEGIKGDIVGAANGLAWTASGGELLVIEALRMKGAGKLVITGKLGEVMRESVQAAHSFIRSRAGELSIDLEALEREDLHIHFPAGAVPKDGPSAGVTVTLALASLLSGRAVRAGFAMTGEVTLRGKVLAVGGVKDKVLAAYRAGIKYVALPKSNEKDLIELP